MNSSKTAIALVVKNEVRDIITWILWHLELGFDTVLVYDDGSNDGTFEILSYISDIYDVRIEKINMPEIDYYYYRQEKVYRNVLQNHALEFEWIAFLDADEYLMLSENTKLKDFLENFSDTDGIAINWCTYGSGGYVLKPEKPSVFSFICHTKEQYGLNLHVKSIVRPRMVGANWQNVHAFDIPLEKYKNADGHSIEWAHIPGIISGQVSWKTAKIAHFQNRSMEQFVERAKKRTDLILTEENWVNSSIACEKDENPLRYKTEILKRFTYVVKYILEKINYSYEKINFSETDLKTGYLRTFHDTFIGYEKITGKFIQVDPASSDKIFVFMSLKTKDILAISENGDSICTPGSSFLSRVLVFKMQFDFLRSRILIQEPLDDKFLTIVPNIHGGEIDFRSIHPQDWERIELVEAPLINEKEVYSLLKVASIDRRIDRCLFCGHILNNKSLFFDNIELINQTDMEDLGKLLVL